MGDMSSQNTPGCVYLLAEHLDMLLAAGEDLQKLEFQNLPHGGEGLWGLLIAAVCPQIARAGKCSNRSFDVRTNTGCPT